MSRDDVEGVRIQSICGNGEVSWTLEEQFNQSSNLTVRALSEGILNGEFTRECSEQH